MCEILIFGGTTEGRELAEFCTKNNINAFISVATDYGESLIENSEFIQIIKGRMMQQDMTNFIIKNNIKTIIDATHPYATEVTKNIISACKSTETKYIRLKRNSADFCEYGKYFDDINSLIEYLNTKQGNIFITTGSKELNLFCRIKNFSERCIVRVLPSENIVLECVKMGFKQSSIIAQKAPFSEEQNIKQLKKYNADFLVTKESGKIGGFEDKVNSAKKCKIELLIIKRPEDNGESIERVKKIILAEKNQ